MEATTHLVVDAAPGHGIQRDLRCAPQRFIAGHAVTAQQEVERHRMGELRWAAEPAVTAIGLLDEKPCRLIELRDLGCTAHREQWRFERSAHAFTGGVDLRSPGAKGLRGGAQHGGESGKPHALLNDRALAPAQS